MSVGKENICMICLQSGAHKLQLECKCHMLVHSKCWNTYCQKKMNAQECMVCHKQSKQNIDNEIDNSTFQNRCMACCCCCLLTEFLLQFI